jgi:Ni/Co efflux regulator RcnB
MSFYGRMFVTPLIVWLIAFSKTIEGQLTQENLDNTKGVMGSRKSKKDRQCHDQTIKDKKQTMIYKTIHRKRQIEQHQHHLKKGVNSGTPESIRTSCSTRDTRLTALVRSPVIGHKWWKADEIVITSNKNISLDVCDIDIS